MVETLPSSCGLIAARKAHELHRAHVPCRILSLILGPDHPGAGVRHFVLVYRTPTGEFFAFDGEGSRPLGRVYPHARDIAAEYSPGSRDPKWLTELDSVHLFGQHALDRRLFPTDQDAR
jgi:hypothetical protein